MARWQTQPLLEVEHLTMRFGGLVAINDLSFTVGEGDITALIGPNGAGKTTVFNCITGFYKPTEGRIAFRHGDLSVWKELGNATASPGQHWSRPDGSIWLLERMPDFEVSARAKVARTFQNIRLFSGMTVLENLLVAQHNALMVASGFSVLGVLGLPIYRHAEKAAIARAEHWLELIGLTDRADDPAGDLPYGAQRRLEIARAMCTGPKMLCLDEPAAGLNPRESLELNALLRTIRELNRSQGLTVFLVEQNAFHALKLAHRGYVMVNGVITMSGTGKELLASEEVRAAYLEGGHH